MLEILGQHRPFLVRGRHLKVACGDRALYESSSVTGELIVTGIEPRTNTLSRVVARRPGGETVAANIDQLVAVAAPRPAPDWYLMDRYVCAADLLACRCVLAWNKSDIAHPPPDATEYRQLGYQFIEVSARTGEGVSTLLSLLGARTSVLVGQSGVGKSSLINRLIPGATAAVGELAGSESLGRHTTTAALMYCVGAGGRLIDTPGVREFVPVVSADQVDHGFAEFRRESVSCRFSDCRHIHEPDCAIKAALEAGRISARRYASYCRLHSSLAS